MSIRPNQTATYWAAGSRDINGKIIYADPVTIDVRWEDKRELFRSATSGEQELSRAVVYVREELDDEGYLYLGVSTGKKPLSLPKAFKIRSKSNIPNLRNTRIMHKIWL